MTEKKKKGASIGNNYAAKSEDKKASTGITIRLTREQKEAYNAYAEECGLSLSKIITNYLDAAINAEKSKK